MKNKHPIALLSAQRNAIALTVNYFAIAAAKVQVPTIDIVIRKDTLAWNAHGNAASKLPIICTYETKAVLAGMSMFDAAANLAKIEKAISHHNLNVSLIPAHAETWTIWILAAMLDFALAGAQQVSVYVKDREIFLTRYPLSNEPEHHLISGTADRLYPIANKEFTDRLTAKLVEAIASDRLPLEPKQKRPEVPQ
ncbi:MAG: hypothetical protein KAT00_02240 [Planctomycetes bacterium]|nr:hypothetical protein [Planctomycetota bacterium]